jgi:hypothetical protein
MKKYTLCNAEIEDKYREIEIYPTLQVDNEFLIHWDGYQVGTIQKWDDKWFTNSVELLTVVNEIGQFIDQYGDVPDS